MLKQQTVYEYIPNSFSCPLVTWLKWEAMPLTVSDAVDKGWILQDECRGEFKTLQI